MPSSFIRILSIIAGGILLFLSILFSANGLGFAIDNKFAILIGWILGIVFTIIEVVFNEEGVKHSSMMIIVMGVFCYIYGITTNVLGLLAWSGMPSMDVAMQTLSENPIKALIPIILGVMLELGAEPLILWGLTGDARDFLNSLVSTSTKKKTQMTNNNKDEREQYRSASAREHRREFDA